MSIPFQVGQVERNAGIKADPRRECPRVQWTVAELTPSWIRIISENQNKASIQVTQSNRDRRRYG
jgi:hypothetical protein